MKKLIDKETLNKIINSEFCRYCKLNGDECEIGDTIHPDCIIWNSLPDARVVGSKTEHTTNDTGLIIKKVEGI